MTLRLNPSFKIINGVSGQALLLILALGTVGDINLAQSDTETAHYVWEWPGDRKPLFRVLVKINKLDKQGHGLLGIRNSPSMASYLPDPMILEAAIIKSQPPLSAQSLILVVPAREIPDLAVGDTAVLGLVDHAACMCVRNRVAHLHERLQQSLQADQRQSQKPKPRISEVCQQHSKTA